MSTELTEEQGIEWLRAHYTEKFQQKLAVVEDEYEAKKIEKKAHIEARMLEVETASSVNEFRRIISTYEIRWGLAGS